MRDPFEHMSAADIEALDDAVSEIGLPGEHRRAYLREHPDEQDAAPE